MIFFDERFRLLLKNIFGSGAARGINLIITVMLVPLTVNALDSADYAYLATAISLSMLTAYADLGMGLAVINVIARKKEGQSKLRAQRAVSVVWFALVWIAIACLLLTAVVAAVLSLTQTEEVLRQYNAMLLAVACVLAGLPAGLVQRILFAKQRNIEANAWATGGKIISLGVVFFLVEYDKAELIYLVFAILGVPVFVSWISVLFLFCIRNSSIRPRWNKFSLRLFKKYSMLGLGYLVLSILPYAESGGDVLLLATFGYSSLIQAFDVYVKLFLYVPAFVSLAALPLWPAVARARAEQDFVWIGKVRKISFFSVSGISLVFSMLLVVYGVEIIFIWTGKNIDLDFWIVTALGVFNVFSCIGTVQASFANGLGFVNQQISFLWKYFLVLIFFKVTILWFFSLVAMLWTCNVLYLCRLVYFNKNFLVKNLGYK